MTRPRKLLVVPLSIIAVLIVATLIAGIYAPEYPQMRWRFGDICSRWNDVGPCRPKTALTLSTLFALLLPLLFGMFVGVRAVTPDIDVGSYLERITVVFLPISAAMTALGLALHWATERSRAATEMNSESSVSFSFFDFPHFETAGVTLGAYTLATMLVGSALVLGFRSRALAGLGTLFVFVFAVPVAFTFIVRDDYGTPTIASEPIDGMSRESEYPPDPYYTTDGTWVVGADYVDANGDTVDPDTRLCAQTYPDDYWAILDGETLEQRSERMRLDTLARADQYDDCLRDQGIDRFDVYSYSENDFWRFQAIETGLMLAFGAAAASFGAWRISRNRLKS